MAEDKSTAEDPILTQRKVMINTKLSKNNQQLIQLVKMKNLQIKS